MLQRRRETDRAAEAISDGDFLAVRNFVHRELGVALTDAKRALVVSRLAPRLRHLQISSYRDYVARAEAQPAERQQLIDAITTNETRFFREPAQFEFLRSRVLPGWAVGRRPVRCWSAACSSGEEPYSIAMLLLENLPAVDGGPHEILATDISSRVLSKAAEGVYPLSKRSDIAAPLLKRFFLRGVRSNEGTMRVTPELRAAVRFAQLNLNVTSSYPEGRFDAIFCRNVLIYFDTESRGRVLAAMVARLLPGGFLFLGHAESLSGHPGTRSVMPNVYVRTS